jgi:hypothetical protein
MDGPLVPVVLTRFKVSFPFDSIIGGFSKNRRHASSNFNGMLHIALGPCLSTLEIEYFAIHVVLQALFSIFRLLNHVQ